MEEKRNYDRFTAGLNISKTEYAIFLCGKLQPASDQSADFLGLVVD